MQEGIVIKSTGSWYEVRDIDGTVSLCRLRGKIRLDGLRTTNPIAVGDKVFYEREVNKDTCVINKILPRHNVIVRKSVNLSKASHIIAANIDQAILVATVAQPRTSTGFIDRFLVTAEAYHIPVTIVFNKCDLYDEEQTSAAESLISTFEEIGYQAFMISAVTGFQCDRLRDIMKDKVNLFSGHSGVGKSALVNRLDPNLNVRVGEISEVHEKGKHTTTFSQMFPLDFGGYIIDTPGIKEFGLYDMEKETLAQRFPEMRRLMHECKFSNCTHQHEPHCAIKDAVENGDIAEWRYIDYCNMMEE
ncbi:MAG: ribosome small subunit-dependent GTPase A [Bacteroidales bacterium]|nr:ribosome small subunit-dependent GTPase A [Lentimicrobiaceae bacterium]MBQ2853571.1 ribosome small subunit-dependent GTPase A [Bacteroidales bacterium]MBR7175907.1 ribosome small subunit-dependent GTPase A [Bacteroidales bacterium]